MEELAAGLRDVGCGPACASEICRLYASGDTGAVKQRLRRVRCELMDALHESQEKVDRLDFLLYELERMEKQNG